MGTNVDYCLKVRVRRLKVVYEPRATVYTLNRSRSSQRFRKVLWNAHAYGPLARRVRFDSAEHHVGLGRIRGVGVFNEPFVVARAAPQVPVLVHGVTSATDRASFERALRANKTSIEGYAGRRGGALGAAREMMNVRGIAFSSSSTRPYRSSRAGSTNWSRRLR